MKRKMVSFILCIAMCMALAIPAFAVELSPYATDEVGNFSQMIEFAFSDNVEGRFRYADICIAFDVTAARRHNS